MKRASWISSLRILIIDSSITDCHSMINTLLRAGYAVDFATNGQDGLTRILAHPPQCLILNAIVPGINGYAICRQLRSGYPPYQTIPIIIMSTKSSSLDQKYAIRMGANGYLIKPFTEEALLQAVQKVLPRLQRPTPPAIPRLQRPTPAILQKQPLSIPRLAIPEASTVPEEYTLIPYRQNEADIMLKLSPFASASIIMSDKQLRRLCVAIDGNRNIQELAEMVQIDLHSTLKLLKTLWQQQYIAFYDKKRRPLKEISIFDSIK